MSGLSGGEGASSLGIEEVAVHIRIQEGKITAESTSGPKAGAVHLETTDDGAELVLSGTGRDQAVATLSRPEISSFRSALAGALSDVTADASPGGDDAAYTGTATVQRIDGGVGVAIDDEALEGLDLPPGGERRQVACSIGADGVATIDLTGGD